MIIFKNPTDVEVENIIQRNNYDKVELSKDISVIIETVKSQGDQAVLEYSRKFEGITNQSLSVSSDSIASRAAMITDELKASIKTAKSNIEKFHQAQLIKPERIETSKGVFCWRKSIPVESVGLYIPGGSAPLFSTLLMLAIPAKIAGCRNIVVATPAQAGGLLHPAIAYVAQLLKLDQVFLMGGAQAIAAMAYGTESVPKVNKILGPGNQYVTAAKQLVSSDKVAIDLPAGPSEVAVIADESANPEFVAADLISQAEHGADSIVLLVSTSEQLITETQSALKQQLANLPRAEIAIAALATSKAVLVPTLEEGFKIINRFAPEHLIIATKNPLQCAELVANAGSVFIGQFSAESFGDYASGTNHVLPTDGYAVNYSGVSVDTFMKKVTFQEITKNGLDNLGETVINLARAEGLEGHARSVIIRRS